MIRNKHTAESEHLRFMHYNIYSRFAIACLTLTAVFFFFFGGGDFNSSVNLNTDGRFRKYTGKKEKHRCLISKNKK